MLVLHFNVVKTTDGGTGEDQNDALQSAKEKGEGPSSEPEWLREAVVAGKHHICRQQKLKTDKATKSGLQSISVKTSIQNVSLRCGAAQHATVCELKINSTVNRAHRHEQKYLSH